MCLAVPLLLCRKARKKAAPQPLRLSGEVMAKVSVLNVAVLENPSPFHSPFRFEISFECSEALADGEAGPVRGGGGPHAPALVFAAPGLPGPAGSPVSAAPPGPARGLSAVTALDSVHCLVGASSPRACAACP